MIERLRYAAQVFGLLFGYWLSYFGFELLEGQPPFRLVSNQSLITFSLLLAVWAVVHAVVMENMPSLDSPLVEHLVSLGKLTIVCILVYSTIAFLVHLTVLSRLMVVVYGTVTYVWLAAATWVLQMLARWFRKPLRRLLVVPGNNVAQLHQLYHLLRQAGQDVSSILSEQPLPAGFPYGGAPLEIAAALEAGPIDMVMIHPLLAPDIIERCVGECQLRGVTTELLIGQVQFPARERRVVDTPYGSAIRLLPYRAEPVAQSLKRLTDLVIAGAALLVLGVPMLVIAALVKLTSDGPVLFVQRRAGLNGRVFPCLKFRTMVVNAEELKRQLTHLNEMSGPVFKMKNDPRVTPLGRYLRKYSLDELPQLLNVLAGHMSVVGPRPPLPSEVERYEPWQRRRLSVRPGLTCLWQISGRNNVDFDYWMSMDLKYIDEWSYLKDWSIILRTVPAVVTGRGAS